MWMDRNTHQGNEDSESEYDVVENLEARNLHVLARPVDQDSEYAGRFLFYTSALSSSPDFGLKPISVTV